MNKQMQKAAIVLVLCLITTSSMAVFYKAKTNKINEDLKATKEQNEILLGKAGAKRDISSDSISFETKITTDNTLSRIEIDELQDRIAELEAELGKKTSKSSNTNSPRKSERGSGGWQSRLEKLKTEDPERYEEIKKWQEEVKNKVNNSFAKKLAFFIDRDTSAMSDDEAAEYTVMLELLDETWKLAEKAQSPDLPGKERWETFREIHENTKNLQPLLDNQRDKEFYNLGLDVGYDENQSVDFVNHVNGVIDATDMSMRSIMGGMGSMMGGRGGRGGSGGDKKPSQNTAGGQ